MGYEVFVMKFKDGEAAEIPYEKLCSVLSKYGELHDGNFGKEFVSNVGEICDYASLSGSESEGYCGVTFSRPTTHEKLPYLIYDLLGIEGTCFFGPDLEFVHSRNNMQQHYPPQLLENLEEGLKVISSPMDSWPLK